LKIGRQLEFNSNGGLDRLELGSQGTVSIGRDAQGRSVVYNGGAADDRISIGSSKVTLFGSVEMNGAGGNDILDIDGGIISVGRSTAGTSVLLNGAAGADQIDLAGSSFTAAGAVRLDGGSESDLLDITGIHRLVLKSGVLMDGGSGMDSFKISADSLAISGNVQFNGGDDGDTASLQGDGSVKGGVSLILGAATSGFQNAEVASRSGLPGGLKISGGVTVDSSAAFATTLDTVRLTNLGIGGAVSILTADGASNVDIDNLTVAGTLTIDTRGGADIVEIERDATFGTSLFRKLATIMLGSGTDSLFIGKDSKNNRALFMANLTADGGSGSSDTRNDIEVDNKFTPPASYTETGFENLVLTPP
jgi:hypothetical protein